MPRTTRNNNRILREAVFYLPETTPDGVVREDIHRDVEEQLVGEFGVFVSSLAESTTFDTVENVLVHDDVIRYEVFIQDTAADIEKLQRYALVFAKELQQDFVYFKKPNGEVYCLDVL